MDDFGEIAGSVSDNSTGYFMNSSDATAGMNEMDNGSSYELQLKLQQYFLVDTIVTGYISHGICLFGIIGNTINIAVLTRKSLTFRLGKLERSIVVGLLALALSDLFYCLFSFPGAFYGGGQNSPSIDFGLVYEAYGTACINCFILCSTWLTVSMAISRYLVICYPQKGTIWLGMVTARVTIIAVFCFGILFNLPRFWWRVIVNLEGDDGTTVFLVKPRPGIHLAKWVYNWLYFFFAILLPLLVLVYCNVFLVRALHVAAKLRKHHTENSEPRRIVTLTLCIIIVMYVVLVVPGELVAFWTPFISHENTVDFSIAVIVCNCIQTLNFAVNFILYCIINVHFRKCIKDLVVCVHLREQMQAPPSHAVHDNATHETSVML